VFFGKRNITNAVGAVGFVSLDSFHPLKDFYGPPPKRVPVELPQEQVDADLNPEEAWLIVCSWAEVCL